MAEYIDLDKFRSDYHFAKRCEDCYRSDYECRHDYSHSRMDFCGFLDDAEIADVAPVVHTHWEMRRNSWYCVNCGKGYKITYGLLAASAYNYCPNCGAKMDEVSG